MQHTRGFKLGDCLIQPADFSVHFLNGDTRPLQPKQMDVLYYLALHHPRVIPRKELIDQVWNSNEYVGEKALTNTIWHLRQNLAEVAGNGDVIETIRKAGYRLLLTPQWQEQQEKNTDKQIRAPRHASDFINNGIQKFSIINLGISFFVLCGLLLAYLLIKPEDQISIPQINQITREPGSEMFPSASPNGRYIAYSWVSSDGQTNMYMLDRTQPQLAAKQLTFDEAEQNISVWSNDGQYLYFSRRNKAKSHCDIIQFKVDTNQERKITECHTRGGYYYLDISPDDKHLAFHGIDKSTRRTGIYFVRLDVDKAEPIRFSCNIDCSNRDRDMAFSPDGKQIAITRRNYWYSEDIILIDLETQKEQLLVSDEADIVGLTWHPDGEQLIYATQNADIRSGYAFNIHSKTKVSLNVNGFSYPSFAKNSKELFFQYQNERYHISKLLIDGEFASSSFPVIESEYSHLYPDYSEQADSIVYVSNESGFYELWMSDSKGMNRQQLTFLKKSVNYPRWSSKGDKVAFLAPVHNSNTDIIYILDIRSKKITALATPFSLHNRPTWSFDDSAIISGVYNNEKTELYKISIEDGTATQLTFDNGRYGVMTSPTTLLYTNLSGGLWQKELGSEPLLKLSKDIFNSRYSWILKENSVYFRNNTPQHQQYLGYDFVQQTLTELLRLPPSKLRGYQEISVNLKKGELLFTSGKSAQSDIKELEHPNLL